MSDRASNRGNRSSSRSRGEAVGDGWGNGILNRVLGDVVVVLMEMEREGRFVNEDEEEELVIEVEDREVGFRRDRKDCLAGKTCKLVVDWDMLILVGTGGTSSRRDSAAACTV